jgi:hypothetical protein
MSRMTGPVAMEGRLQHPPLAQVLLAVEQKERLASEDGLEAEVRLAGAQILLVAREDRSDGVGMAEQDDRGRLGQAQREDLPVARRALVHQGERPLQPAQRLEERRGVGTWRQREVGE